MPDLRHLYQTIMLENARHPRHSGILTGPNVNQITVHNPTCGDELILSGTIAHAKLIAIAQQSQGCIISQASASIMADLVLGKSFQQIQELAAIFVRLVDGHKVNQPDLLQQAVAFAGVGQFSMRVKCALLPWQALTQLIEGDQ